MRTAYFIGGSWDLTKKVQPHSPPVLQIEVWPQLSALEVPSPSDIETMAQVTIKRETYVRIRHSGCEDDVAIYMLEEILK